MVVGVLQFDLLIHGCESIKDKRRVVNSVKDRLHREHMVSVAEVALQDRMDAASMALACVGPDGKRVGHVLDRVSAKLRSLGDAELGEMSRQLISAADLPPPQDDPEDDAELARELREHYARGGPAQQGEER